MIKKILSLNDTGETESHQAGIHVPKRKEILQFFPLLNGKVKNPRAEMYFTDEDGQKWKFNFIYYNNKYFGGTRDEYRLTGMTSFIKSKNLKARDCIIFSEENRKYFVRTERANKINTNKPLKLSSTWITIKL